MISVIDEKLSNLSTKVTTEKIKNTVKLKDEIITKKLKMLHKKFVVLIDNVSGNVAFICQMPYVQALINELGLNNLNNTTQTFTKTTKLVEKVISENMSFLKNEFNL